MEIYLVRHGQSEANLTGTVSTPQTPLTKQGENDAKEAGEMLEGIAFDKIYTSPYLRAIQTQEIAMGVKGEILDCVHEFDCGKMEGHTWQYCIENFCKDGHILWDDDNFTSVGGESYADMRARCREFMSFVETLSCEKIVVFSHAGFMLTLVDEIMKRESKIGRNIECDNGCVCVLKCNDGVWKIKRWNIKKSDAIKKDSVVY